MAETTLNNNPIKTFILRFDTPNLSLESMKKMILRLSPRFDRTEERVHSNINIHLTEKGHDVNKTDHKDYVLISDSDGAQLTFSEMNKCFSFQTAQYKDYLTYKRVIDDVASSIQTESLDVKTARLGMRFINEIKCSKLVDIKKKLSKNTGAVISAMCSNDNSSRAVAIEEYTTDDLKVRFQYGILNKYYPSKLVNYDLTLDIDVYIDYELSLHEWDDALKKLNHTAFDIFKNAVSIKMLEEMK